MCFYMVKGEYNHNSDVIACIWTRVIMMMIMKIERCFAYFENIISRIDNILGHGRHVISSNQWFSTTVLKRKNSSE